ncbi:MAG: hypothetical protein V3U30_01315 [Thermoplasmata archaeon]
MLERIFAPVTAFAIRDFLRALLSRRTLTLSLVLGIIFIGTGVALAQVFLGIPPPADPPPEGIPNPLEVWHNGGDGILIAIGYGLIPLILPALAVSIANASMAKDSAGRVSEVALSKPVPPWGPALGKFIGLIGATAILTVALSLGIAVAIQGTLGTSLNSNLVTTFVGANVLLAALYIALTLVLATLFSPRAVTILMVLIWLGFNVLRQAAFSLSLRLATLVGADEALTFTATVSDLGSFTGLYQGLLAFAVPAGLGFIVPPDPSMTLEQFATVAVPWASLAWLGVLILLFTWLRLRVPNQ